MQELCGCGGEDYDCRLDDSNSVCLCIAGVDFCRFGWVDRTVMAYSVQNCCSYEYNPNAEPRDRTQCYYRT